MWFFIWKHIGPNIVSNDDKTIEIMKLGLYLIKFLNKLIRIQVFV